VPKWAPSTGKVCTRLGREASTFVNANLEAALLAEFGRTNPAEIGTAPTTRRYSAACSLPEVGMLL
jgi:hypothetical protein